MATVVRFGRFVLLVEAIILGVIGIIGLILGWDSAGDWANAIFIAGAAVGGLGTMALLGATMSGGGGAGITRGHYLYAQTAAHDGITNAMRRERDHAISAGGVAVVAGITGAVTIGIAWALSQL